MALFLKITKNPDVEVIGRGKYKMNDHFTLSTGRFVKYINNTIIRQMFMRCII